MIAQAAADAQNANTWWVTPLIAGSFALLGVAITLFVNHRLQSARDKRDRRAKEYEQLCEWTERALAAGGSIYRWAGNQETPTFRSDPRKAIRETLALVDGLTRVIETQDLYVPDEVSDAAKEFALEATLLSAPVWNENGYAAQKSDYLEARLGLVNAVRKFGDMPLIARERVEVPTYTEQRETFLPMVTEGMAEHMRFRGFSEDEIAEAKKSWSGGDDKNGEAPPEDEKPPLPGRLSAPE